jgi:uncharacterized protein (TIGR03086 family)
MLNLTPATRAAAELVAGVPDDLCTSPTLCPETTVGDLLDHLDQLSTAAAAGQASGNDAGSPPEPDAARLGPDWSERITGNLAALADAWSEESAWTGMTHAGGLDLPAEIAGVVALDELVVHGWDLAVASGQRVAFPPDLLEAAYAFVEANGRPKSRRNSGTVRGARPRPR